MANAELDGLDARWAQTAARRVLPDIGARVFAQSRIDADSAAADALASALIEAFNAGAHEWNTEFQARLIEAGLDLNLREVDELPSRMPDHAPVRTHDGRLTRNLAAQTDVDPATVARAITVMVLLPVAMALAAWFLLNGTARGAVLIVCGLWLAVLAVARLRSDP